MGGGERGVSDDRTQKSRKSSTHHHVQPVKINTRQYEGVGHTAVIAIASRLKVDSSRSASKNKKGKRRKGKTDAENTCDKSGKGERQPRQSVGLLVDAAGQPLGAQHRCLFILRK